MAQSISRLAKGDPLPADPTPAQVVAALPAGAQAIVAKMQKKVDQLTSTFLWDYYLLGKMALKLREKIGPRHNYGSQTMPMLAAHIGINSRTLYDCQRVADQIPEDEYRKVIRPGVCWGHVQVLLTHWTGPGLNPDIEAWAERISMERLTVEQFQARLGKSKWATSTASGGGITETERKMTLRTALIRLDKIVSTFASKTNVDYFGQSYDVVAAIQNSPPDQFSDEMRHQIASVADCLDEIAADAAKNAQDMRELLPFVDGRIRKQRAQEAAMATAGASSAIQVGDSTK